MCGPEFFTWKPIKQVVERFAEATCITDRIVGYDEGWGCHMQDKNPRKRPDHARGRSGRNTPCRKLASSLKNWTSAHRPDVRERNVTILAHRDRQNSESCSHRKILVPIRLFATARRLMMNTLRGRHVEHLPLTAETITEIQILAWRAARKERCKTSDRLERFATQCTRSATDPFARYRIFAPSSENHSEVPRRPTGRVRNLSLFHAGVFDRFARTESASPKVD